MLKILTGNIRLPLFIRVVALYVVVSVPILAFQSQPPSTAAAIAPSQTIVTPASKVTFEQSNRISGKPTRIGIKRLGIDLAVVNGDYDKTTDAWTLTDDKAQYASMTDIPNNESGNTFIYGHDRPAVFESLDQLTSGDEVSITTDNGKIFTYVFNGQQIVNPDATSILAPSQTPILTLMTCEGIFSEARRVVIFNFKDVV